MINIFIIYSIIMYGLLLMLLVHFDWHAPLLLFIYKVNGLKYLIYLNSSKDNIKCSLNNV